MSISYKLIKVKRLVFQAVFLIILLSIISNSIIVPQISIEVNTKENHRIYVVLQTKVIIFVPMELNLLLKV